MNTKFFFNTRDLVLASLFIALSVVFSRMFGIQVSEGLRISFAQTPIILAGVILGPIWGFAVGVIADVTGFMITPMGAFLPGITLSSGLIGLIPGLISKYVFKKNLTVVILFSVLIDMLIVNGLLTTYWLSLAFGSRTFAGWFSARIVFELGMCVVNFAVCTLIVQSLKTVLFERKAEKIKELETT